MLLGVVSVLGLGSLIAQVSAAGAAVKATSCGSLGTARVGKISGIVRPVASPGSSGGACPAPAGASGTTPPASPYDPNGSPPLVYHSGGSVMGASAAVTVTPIFWAPAGFSFPSTYKSLITQFLTDVAHDSGTSTNVFSNLEQYTNGSGTHILYDLTAGTAIDDTTAYPTSGGCSPDSGQVYPDTSGYSACLTDAQLQTELASVLATHSLTSDGAHLYLLLLPKGVESCFETQDNTQGGECTLSPQGGAFCGYHSYAGSTLYADLPYAVEDLGNHTCSSDGGKLQGGGSVGNQSPNGNLDADTLIGIASHEINEAITDPNGNAWYDGVGYEIGDDCAYIYGDSSTFGGSAGAKYNQTINGHHYFIQEEFSNQNYAAHSSNACVQSALPSSTVTFNANGGTGSMAAQTANVPTALTSNSFTRSGSAFTGWNTAANGTGTSYADGATYPFTASTTLYAQWAANTSSTVTFNANGGTGSMAAQTANVPTALTSNSFTRSGSAFTGWNTAANGTATSYADGATYPFTASTTLYAQWAANTSSTVTFNANGGTGSMAAQTANVPTALTSNSFTRSGSAFTGWNTAANGTATSYADGATYPFTASTTLYAQWAANTSSTVTFNANGGTGSMAAQTANVPTALTSNSFTRSGSAFTGWNTAANGTATSYADGATYPFTASTTLYAQWSGGSGGRGGGGGGGGSANLAVAVSGPSSGTVGSGVQLVIDVINKGGNADSSTLAIDLAGVAYGSAQVDRGPGCSGSGSTISCSLDFFPGGTTSRTIVNLTLTSLPATARVSVSSSPGDSDPSDNSASWSLSAPPPVPTTPLPITPVPYQPPAPKPAGPRLFRFHVVKKGPGGYHIALIGNGNTTKLEAAGRYVAGSQLTLTAHPWSGKTVHGKALYGKFVRWKGVRCAGGNRARTCTIPAAATSNVKSLTVTAIFVPRYALLTRVVGHGRISKKPGGRRFPAGTVVKPVAVSGSGWLFSRWHGACRSSLPSCVVRMTRPLWLEAIFVKE